MIPWKSYGEEPVIEQSWKDFLDVDCDFSGSSSDACTTFTVNQGDDGSPGLMEACASISVDCFGKITAHATTCIPPFHMLLVRLSSQLVLHHST